MDEHDIGLAIVAEPYRILEGNPNWFGVPGGSVTVIARKTKSPLPCTLLAEEEDFVSVKWGDTVFVGVYLSPRLRISEVEDRQAHKINRLIFLHYRRGLQCPCERMGLPKDRPSWEAHAGLGNFTGTSLSQ